MAYVPDWERLPDVVNRVTAWGISEDQAKFDISRAIADKKMRTRVTVVIEPDAPAIWQQMILKAQGLGLPRHNESIGYFDGPNVKVPPHLTAADFDWENSRPLKPWPVRPRGGSRDKWQSFSRPASLIELHTADVLSWMYDTYSAPAVANGRAEQTPATAGQETKAINALTEYLKSVPKEARTHVTRDKAWAWCREQRFSISWRGFQSHVWPEARQGAGLQRHAPPGRKPKSSR
jgi:hypothetical protein